MALAPLAPIWGSICLNDKVYKVLEEFAEFLFTNSQYQITNTWTISIFYTSTTGQSIVRIESMGFTSSNIYQRKYAPNIYQALKWKTIWFWPDLQNKQQQNQDKFVGFLISAKNDLFRRCLVVTLHLQSSSIIFQQWWTFYNGM